MRPLLTVCLGAMALAASACAPSVATTAPPVGAAPVSGLDSDAPDSMRWLYASGEAESIFAGFTVHVISGNQVISEV